MGPEMKVHTWLKKKIKEKYPDAYIYKPRAGTYGKKGVPDFIFCINGLFIAIEVKASIESKPTKLQEIELDRIKLADGVGAVLHGKDEEFINRLFTYISTYVIQRL